MSNVTINSKFEKKALGIIFSCKTTVFKPEKLFSVSLGHSILNSNVFINNTIGYLLQSPLSSLNLKFRHSVTKKESEFSQIQLCQKS